MRKIECLKVSMLSFVYSIRVTFIWLLIFTHALFYINYGYTYKIVDVNVCERILLFYTKKTEKNNLDMQVYTGRTL